MTGYKPRAAQPDRRPARLLTAGFCPLTGQSSGSGILLLPKVQGGLFFFISHIYALVMKATFTGAGFFIFGKNEKPP